MKRPDTWMPFYVGDYLRDTSRLTRDQHGGYLLLIMDYWINGPLPDDDGQLAAIVKASPEEWARLRPALSRFFVVADGVWRHKRIDAELATARSRYEQRVAASKAGVEARRQTERSTERSTGPLTVVLAQPQPQPPQKVPFQEGTVSLGGGGVSEEGVVVGLRSGMPV
jgi:uncharacterized protein YdaU (DUF1376 family)